MKNLRLFVYGSLKRGESNQQVLRGALFLGLATTECRYRLIDYHERFPALTEVGPDCPPLAIHGELYEVSPECIRRLDEFEEVPTLYERTSIRIHWTDTHQHITAEAYTVRWELAQTFSLHPEACWRSAPSARG